MQFKQLNQGYGKLTWNISAGQGEDEMRRRYLIEQTSVRAVWLRAWRLDIEFHNKEWIREQPFIDIQDHSQGVAGLLTCIDGIPGSSQICSIINT